MSRLNRELLQPEKAIDLRLIDHSTGEIVKSPFGDVNDVIPDEFSPLPCAVLGVFQAAFPFQHGPALIIILGHFRENTGKIDLSITQ